MEMKDVLKIMLNGAYTNFKRILFAADRVTDMELRNAILTGTVEPDKKVDEEACIGCGGCANVCLTGAVTMKPLQSPVKFREGWVKTEVPELDPLKCVVCYWCHDFCPMYSFFEEAGTIHPGNVGEINIDTEELLSEPIKISQEKISFIAQYLSDKSILSKNVVSEDEDIENVGVGLERVSKIQDIQDNITEKYEKDVKRSSEINAVEEESSDEGSSTSDENSLNEGGE
jgi:energy-converting hydrogenase B subunit L